MTIDNVTLEATVVAKSGFPAAGLPEIALCGRSNVGKSSLINALTGRKALARISQNPGKTRTINFYNIEGAMYLVDLPGYGYAKAPKSESAKWGGMIEGYLKGRKELRAIALLLDVRHTPSRNDHIMYDFITHYNHDVIAVLTKADKVTRNALPARVKDIRSSLKLPESAPIIPFSSETKAGRDELWAEILRVLGLTSLKAEKGDIR